MAWKKTPKSRLIMARRLEQDTGIWTECLYTDLKPGDFFRAFSGDSQIDPVTHDLCVDDDIVAFVLGSPFRAQDRGEGFMIEVTTGSWPEIIQMVSH